MSGNIQPMKVFYFVKRQPKETINICISIEKRTQNIPKKFDEIQLIPHSYFIFSVNKKLVQMVRYACSLIIVSCVLSI